MKEQFKIDFAKRLDHAIESQHRTRSEVATSAGIKYPTLASYLNNRNNGGAGALPPLDVAARLSGVLGVSLDELCGCSLPETTQRSEIELPHIDAPTSVSTTTKSAETDAQKALRNIHQAVSTLNISVDIEKNGAIIFKSTNHFLRLFFEQIMAGAELDDIISMFGGVKLLSGELVDPITYQIETTKEQKL